MRKKHSTGEEMKSHERAGSRRHLNQSLERRGGNSWKSGEHHIQKKNIDRNKKSEFGEGSEYERQNMPIEETETGIFRDYEKDSFVDENLTEEDEDETYHPEDESRGDRESI